MIKKIIIGILIVVIVLFLYGYFKGVVQYNRGVSLFEISVTMNSLNPISEQGYIMYMRSNENVMNHVNDFLNKYGD